MKTGIIVVNEDFTFDISTDVQVMNTDTGTEVTLVDQTTKLAEKAVKGISESIDREIARWGLTKSFLDVGYDCIFGELMFGLGFPIPIRSVRALKILAALLYPIAMRLPFAWLYPTGDKQTVREPKWEKYYQWASVIAGDNNYIVRHMPDRLEGKVIVTNTTTAKDIAFFRDAGIAYVVTSTPVLEGRTFGTNMMEAAFIAASGKQRKLSDDELTEMLDRLDFEPPIQKLN